MRERKSFQIKKKNTNSMDKGTEECQTMWYIARIIDSLAWLGHSNRGAVMEMERP